MTPQRLAELVLTFPSRRIAVIGDFFLDKAEYFKTPLCHVDGRRGTAGVEDGPFYGLALTRRDSLFAPGIGRNDHSEYWMYLERLGFLQKLAHLPLRE